MASYQVLISPLFNGPITRLLAFEVDRYNDECARDFVLELLVLWNSMVLINWYFICILASWLVLACSIFHLDIIPLGEPGSATHHLLGWGATCIF